MRWLSGGQGEPEPGQRMFFVGSPLPLWFDYIHQFLDCGLTPKPDLVMTQREREREREREESYVL